MRGIRRLRKRNVYILNAIFIASALLFYEVNTDLFLKNFAEKKLEKIFPKENIDIGNIKGGILRDLIIEDVKVSSKEFKTDFTVKRIEINYRFWDPILQKIPSLSNLRSDEKVIVFLGGKKEDVLNGFIELEGRQDKFDVMGVLQIKDDWKVFIRGIVEKDGRARFRITKEKGIVDLTISRKKDNFLIKAKINHIKLNNVDFIGECEASVFKENENILNSNIVFKNIIINYIPFDKEIEATLRYDKSRYTLNIIKFTTGEEIKGHGSVKFIKPYDTFLKWDITNLNLEEYCLSKDEKINIKGIMNGSFMLKGPINNIKSSAHFDVQEGHYGDLDYDSIIFNLKGNRHIIFLKDSMVRKEGGFIKLGGEIDLSKIKENKVFEKFTMNPGDNFFVWEGWSFKKEYEDSTLTAEKPVSEELNLSFKAFSDGEEQEEHFLGVEHKVKF